MQYRLYLLILATVFGKQQNLKRNVEDIFYAVN